MLTYNMLEGRDFTIFTDHKPLTHALFRTSPPWSARQQRQLAYLAEFTSSIIHVPGKENLVADALSRPISIPTPRPNSPSPGSIKPCSVSPGSIKPCSVSPGSVGPCSVSPGFVKPCSVSPGSVKPCSAPNPVSPSSQLSPKPVQPHSLPVPGSMVSEVGGVGGVRNREIKFSPSFQGTF